MKSNQSVPVEASSHAESGLFQTMIEHLEVPLWLCDKEGRVVSLNALARTYLNDKGEQAIGRPFNELIPGTEEDFSENIEQAVFSGMSSEVESDISLSNGQRCIVWSFNPIFHGSNNIAHVQIVAKDLTDHKLTEKRLASRLAYEHCISKCSQTLLTDPGETREVLDRALHHLQEATGVCRVYIFKNHEEPGRGLLTSQICEFCAPGVRGEIENPVLQNVPYEDGLERWQNELLQGKAINGSVSCFPSSERKLLVPQGIISILVLPIFAGDKWFGLIGFDDTKTDRKWSDEDIRLLNTAAEMIGTFIERRRVYKALELEHLQLISIFDTINEPIYVADPETFEILYQNDTLSSVFGDCVGQKCHKALQNYDSQCPFCTNQHIFGENLGKSYIWEFQSTQTKRWYRCIDRAIQWPDKRMVRCEVAIDIDEIKRSQEKLRSAKQKVDDANRSLNVLTEELRERNESLQEALDNVEQLSGLLPICANCKKIRDDKGYWNQIENYIESHSCAQFSHGICDECAESLYKDTKWYQKRKESERG